jgi:hypothetical protein
MSEWDVMNLFCGCLCADVTVHTGCRRAILSHCNSWRRVLKYFTQAGLSITHLVAKTKKYIHSSRRVSTYFTQAGLCITRLVAKTKKYIHSRSNVLSIRKAENPALAIATKNQFLQGWITASQVIQQHTLTRLSVTDFGANLVLRLRIRPHGWLSVGLCAFRRIRLVCLRRVFIHMHGRIQI